MSAVRKKDPAKNGNSKVPDSAERVTALRNRLGLTQQGFGELLGISMVTVSRWEHEHSEPNEPSIVLIELLERALKRKKAPDVIDALSALPGGRKNDTQRFITLVNLGN